MISYLEGDLELKRTGWVIVKTGGVGYKVAVTPAFLDILHEGTFVKMYIFTQVREDILALYGFATVSELDLFELLLTVSGIGPKAAQNILSATTVENIKRSIVSNDPTIISSVSGVGKKTAEKVALELICFTKEIDRYDRFIWYVLYMSKHSALEPKSSPTQIIT